MDWKAAKAVFAAHIRFVVRFPTIYEFSKEKKVDYTNLKDILRGLIDAGWIVEPTEVANESGAKNHEALLSVLRELESESEAKCTGGAADSKK